MACIGKSKVISENKNNKLKRKKRRKKVREKQEKEKQEKEKQEKENKRKRKQKKKKKTKEKNKRKKQKTGLKCQSADESVEIAVFTMGKGTATVAGFQNRLEGMTQKYQFAICWFSFSW